MSRVKFKQGDQRKFFIEVLKSLNCPSLRAFKQFGFDISYSTLKNYFSEKRTISEDFFNELSSFSNVDKKGFEFRILDEKGGQIKGGKKGKRQGLNT